MSSSAQPELAVDDDELPQLPLAEDLPMDDDLPDHGDLLPEERPTVQEYRERWAAKLTFHSRENPGSFSHRNLVPKPDHRLWQDCPSVAFDQLTSTESQARLSVCRPISGLSESAMTAGVPTYAHNTGEVHLGTLKKT